MPRKLIFLTFLVVLFATINHVADAAFGTSPPFLNADHLVPGAKYFQTIYLVQDRPTEDLTIRAALEIPDKIRSWISLDKGFDFVIPKGTNQFPVKVIISVPKDAAIGYYRGNLSFTTAPAQSGQVTIALGAQVVVNMTVGKDIYRQFSVPLTKFLDIEEGWDPLVYVKVQNDGNVPESFTSASYELFDKLGAVRLAYVQKDKGFPETPPFTASEYTLEFPVDFHLGLGSYWGVVNFYQDDKLVASQKTIFNVLKKGSLSGPMAQIIRILDKNRIYLGAAAIIAVFAGWFAFRISKRKRRV